MQKILITGTNSGIGKALAKLYLDMGYTVYGIGKKEQSAIKHKHFSYLSLDLRVTESIAVKLSDFINEISSFKIVILNAGILGDIKDVQNTPIYEIENILRVNVWANKVIIDTLISLDIEIEQIVGISSGAAVNANRGWGSYSISKSALNTLLKLYSAELARTHIVSLAPGVVDTPMVRYIFENADEDIYSSVKRLKNGSILKPKEAAKRIVEALKEVKRYESGSFVDIRNL